MVNEWRGAKTAWQYGLERQVKHVSVALWCDKGQHAFSEKDENRQHFTQTKKVDVLTGNSYGQPTYQQRQEVTEELDICGPCWAKGNDFEPAKVAEINSPTLDELEQDDENYRAGYAAAERAAELRATKLHKNAAYGAG